ncbi:MAG: ABC transporter permease [Polyangiaceae bacterium]|nr:ABC transporter permease [Polyangiaceae bacterium]
MRLRRGLVLSLRALLAHRGRALLAVVSVAIGVAAVLVTSATGEGARAEVLREISALGTNLLVIRSGQVERSAARKQIRGRVTSLRLGDWRAIRTLATVREAAPCVDQRLRVKAGRGSASALVFGTSSSFFTLRGLKPELGRVFDPLDDAAAARVAVLGARVAATLFPGQNPVGETLRVRGVPFEVIGVLVARGVLVDGADEDGNVFIPIRTALRRVLGSAWLSSVFVSSVDADHPEGAEFQIRSLLRDRHRLAREKADDFDIQNQAKLLSMRRALADSLTLLAGGLAGVSLLVGGTGVMALMLLSVKERTAEIGLRLAVGARPRDVFLQFLVEAAVLALGGWLLGVALGAVGVGVAALTTDWPVAVPEAGLLATLVASGLSGVGFGALPARRAARLPPIRALGAG